MVRLLRSRQRLIHANFQWRKSLIEYPKTIYCSKQETLKKHEKKFVHILEYWIDVSVMLCHLKHRHSLCKMFKNTNQPYIYTYIHIYVYIWLILSTLENKIQAFETEFVQNMNIVNLGMCSSRNLQLFLRIRNKTYLTY